MQGGTSMFYEKVQNSAEFIKSRTKHNPTIGVILGIALGKCIYLKISIVNY